MNKVGIIDYAAGNLASVFKAVEYTGGDSTIISKPEEILKCDRLILPGVGAAGGAVANLRANHLIEALNEKVRRQATPFLGICLGMQLLSNVLHEFGQHQGLGWIPGEVVHLNQITDERIRVPHMGWNEVNFKENEGIFSENLHRHRYFYFAHSFSFKVSNPTMIAATVRYGTEFVAAVKSKTVFATQFHPEKSQIAGDILIQAFMNWSP